MPSPSNLPKVDNKNKQKIADANRKLRAFQEVYLVTRREEKLQRHKQDSKGKVEKAKKKVFRLLPSLWKSEAAPKDQPSTIQFIFQNPEEAVELGLISMEEMRRVRDFNDLATSQQLKQNTTTLSESKLSLTKKTKRGGRVKPLPDAEISERVDEESVSVHTVSTSDMEQDLPDMNMIQIVNQFERKVSWGLFMADSPGHVGWDLVGFVCIIYQMFVTPYRICFDAEAEGFWAVVENLIDGVFILDIVVSFNTSYFDKGILVAERKKVVLNYL